MNRKLYDLTNPQMNIWATEQYYNNTAVNNVGGTVLLKAKLNFNILQKAVANVLRKMIIFIFILQKKIMLLNSILRLKNMFLQLLK